MIFIEHVSMNMIFNEQFSMNMIFNEQFSMNMISNEQFWMNMIYDEHFSVERGPAKIIKHRACQVHYALARHSSSNFKITVFPQFHNSIKCIYMCMFKFISSCPLLILSIQPVQHTYTQKIQGLPPLVVGHLFCPFNGPYCGTEYKYLAL